MLSICIMNLTSIWQPLASIWHFLFFSNMNPLIKKGCRKELDEESANCYFRGSFDSEQLSTQLDSTMQDLRPKLHKHKNILKSAILKLNYKHAFNLISATIFISGIRFGSALIYEQLLKWFEDENGTSADGWTWGIPYALMAFIENFATSQVILYGTMVSYKIHLAILALIHKKIFKLNTAVVSWQTTGQIVNFASNDLRNFEDGAIVLTYLVQGPIDAIVLFILIGVRVDWFTSFLTLIAMLFFIIFQLSIMGHISSFEQKVLSSADARVNATSEMIAGILTVKCFTWENSIFSKIKLLRKIEQTQLFKKEFIAAFILVAYYFVPCFIPLVTFTSLVLSGQQFDIATAFFVLAVIESSRVSITIAFPMSIGYLVQIKVSLKRLNDFFNLEESNLLLKNKTETEHGSNDFEDCLSEPKGTIDAKIKDYGWLLKIKNDNTKTDHLDESQKPLLSQITLDSQQDKKTYTENLKSVQALHDISFKVAPGELIGIVGEVGSGKSSLLLALLGEMQDLNNENSVLSNNVVKSSNKHHHHHQQMYGSVSYCAQSPWIISGTIKENIILGSEFDIDWYQKVIKGCSLEMDLAQFPAGDQTELGERGINLSGGQKARISLARAAYKKADINLLDDPLSAVDPRVANTLFDFCIGGSPDGLMCCKTRLLVSHQVQFMHRCDRVIIMDSGHIAAMATYDELIKSEFNQVFKRLAEFEHTDNTSNIVKTSKNENNLESENRIKLNSSINETLEPIDSINGKLIEKEEKRTGSVSWHVYWSLFKYFGFFKLLFILLILISFTSLLFISQFWIYAWADQPPVAQKDTKWILGLAIMCALMFIWSFLYSILIQRFTLGSLTRIHFEMLKSVLSAPLSFFHTNPTGRIINRFSKDQNMADNSLISVIDEIFETCVYTFGIILVICISLPLISLLFPVYIYIAWKFSDMYLKTSREVRRYHGITRSPIYEKISENLKGLATIRAYNLQNIFNNDIFIPILNKYGTWWICYERLVRWYAVRLDFMGNCILLTSTILAISVRNYIKTEYISIAFLNIMSMVFIVQYLVRIYASIENSMTSVERMLEYTKLEKEPDRVEDGADPGPPKWPHRGKIQFNSVSSRYRKELGPVLNKLTFEIKEGTSVGIIGRTGSGKSSFLMTLYRLIEKIEGKMYLDDIDIEMVGVDVLRKNLAMIPQDPILFEGSLRFNLDPWNRFMDERLWEILDMVQLKDVIGEVGGLDVQLSEGGSNFSVGQRQLLCLARALLKDAKILTIDEATANVDNQTDTLVQSAIRKFVNEKNEFGEKYRTLFIIAHRLDTILDCDMLLVFDKGKIVEMGSPTDLKTKTGGFFSSMLEASNDL